MKLNICGVGLFMLAVAVSAKVPEPAVEKPLEITADETSVVDGVAIAVGHVTLTYGTIIITAARLEYYPDFKLVKCVGVGQVVNGDVKTAISDQTYDLKAKKIVVPKEEVPPPTK